MTFVNHPENELQLYINGKPVYKRRLNTGELKIFDGATYERYRLASPYLHLFRLQKKFNTDYLLDRLRNG